LNAAEALADLAERYWAFECVESPFSAIQAGVATSATDVFRDAAADHARRNAAAALFLTELDAISTQGLSPQENATHELLKRELESIRTEYAVDASLRPWLLPVGPDFNTIFFANSTVLGTLDAAALYIERLRSFPKFLADIQDNLRVGYAKNIRYSRAVLQAAAANTPKALGTARSSARRCTAIRLMPMQRRLSMSSAMRSSLRCAALPI
jgi:uncharacterized protein (DUF885 family)